MLLSPRLASHLRSGQVSRVIYGSIIGLAVVLTMEAHPSTPVVAVGTLLATAMAVALAELYSEFVGARAQASVSSEPEPFSRSLEVAGAVAYETAFDLVRWTGLGLISGYGFLAARLSGESASKSLLQAVGVGLIAAVLIVLKALIH